MMDYYQREKLHPTKAEISAKFAAALRTHPDLLGKMMLNKQSRFEIGGSMAFGVASSVDWVVTKHLHEKYGGSVADQQLWRHDVDRRPQRINPRIRRSRETCSSIFRSSNRALWEQAEKKVRIGCYRITDQKRVLNKSSRLRLGKVMPLVLRNWHSKRLLTEKRCRV